MPPTMFTLYHTPTGIKPYASMTYTAAKDLLNRLLFQHGWKIVPMSK